MDIKNYKRSSINRNKVVDACTESIMNIYESHLNCETVDDGDGSTSPSSSMLLKQIDLNEEKHRHHHQQQPPPPQEERKHEPPPSMNAWNPSVVGDDDNDDTDADGGHPATAAAAAAAVSGYDPRRWRKWFVRELFLLTQFNVHYFAWIKNPDKHFDYVERLLVFFESHLLPLCRLNPKWKEIFAVMAMAELRKWLLYQSIQDGFDQQREINIQIKDLKFQDIPLVYNANLEKSVCENKQFLIVCQLDPRKANKKPIVLGRMDLENNCYCSIKLPLKTNYTNRDCKIQMILVERKNESTGQSLQPNGEPNQNDDKDGTQRLLIIDVYEGSISGFNGLKRSCMFYHVPQDDPDEEKSGRVGFSVSFQWSISADSYGWLTDAQTIDLLNYISSCLVYLGSYPYHFFRSFFWAIFHRAEFCRQHWATLRVVLHHLFLVVFEYESYLDPNQEELSLFFQLLYKNPVEDGHKCFDRMDLLNLCMTFNRFSFPDQVYYVEKFGNQLIQTEEFLTKESKLIDRWINLISLQAGNYETEPLYALIVPLCNRWLQKITKTSVWSEIFRSPDTPVPKDLCKAIKNLCKLVNSIISLLLQCIDYLKPLNWQQLSINDPQMTLVRNVLEQCITYHLSEDDDDHDAATNGHHLLYIIYMRIWKQELVLREHLLPLLTEERLGRYRYLVQTGEPSHPPNTCA